MSTRPRVEPSWEQVVADTEDAFARGAIDRETWHARMAAINVPAYLAGSDPRAQTGYTGDEAEWRQARSLVADALPRSGRFLDVGCAGGLLMESVQIWCDGLLANLGFAGVCLTRVGAATST